jgi:hypothetical protein
MFFKRNNSSGGKNAPSYNGNQKLFTVVHKDLMFMDPCVIIEIL